MRQGGFLFLFLCVALCVAVGASTCPSRTLYINGLGEGVGHWWGTVVSLTKLANLTGYAVVEPCVCSGRVVSCQGWRQSGALLRHGSCEAMLEESNEHDNGSTLPLSCYFDWQVHAAAMGIRTLSFYDFVPCAKKLGMKAQGKAWASRFGYKLKPAEFAVDVANMIPPLPKIPDPNSDTLYDLMDRNPYPVFIVERIQDRGFLWGFPSPMENYLKNNPFLVPPMIPLHLNAAWAGLQRLAAQAGLSSPRKLAVFHWRSETRPLDTLKACVPVMAARMRYHLQFHGVPDVPDPSCQTLNTSDVGSVAGVRAVLMTDLPSPAVAHKWSVYKSSDTSVFEAFVNATNPLTLDGLHEIHNFKDAGVRSIREALVSAQAGAFVTCTNWNATGKGCGDCSFARSSFTRFIRRLRASFGKTTGQFCV